MKLGGSPEYCYALETTFFNYLPLCIRTVSAVLVDVCAVTTVTKLNQMITTCSDTRDTRLGSM